MKGHQAKSKPFNIFVSSLMTGNQNGALPSIVVDNARSHGLVEFFEQNHDHARRPPTPSNSFCKRQGAARWDDSLEISEHQKSPGAMRSPNSVLSADKLVSPRRGNSSTTENSPMRKRQDSTRLQSGTGAFLASLPLDVGGDCH